MTVIGLGAWCDFVTDYEYRQRLVGEGWPADEIESLVEEFKRGLSFIVHEFADLSDGRRSHCMRSGVHGIDHGEQRTSAERPIAPPDLDNLERDVRTTVLPDDGDTQDEHPWNWLAELLYVHGVEVTAEELRLVPYDVVFSERLRVILVGGASTR